MWLCSLVYPIFKRQGLSVVQAGLLAQPPRAGTGQAATLQLSFNHSSSQWLPICLSPSNKCILSQILMYKSYTFSF